MAHISYLQQVCDHPRAGQAEAQVHVCKEPLQAWDLSGLWKQVREIVVPASWQVGRLQGAVTVSVITAGFGNAVSTAVSISEQNARHWHKHFVL